MSKAILPQYYKTVRRERGLETRAGRISKVFYDKEDAPPTPRVVPPKQQNPASPKYWKKQELERLYEGVELYGWNFEKVSKYVKTRTRRQARDRWYLEVKRAVAPLPVEDPVADATRLCFRDVDAAVEELQRLDALEALKEVEANTPATRPGGFYVTTVARVQRPTASPKFVVTLGRQWEATPQSFKALKA